MFKLKAFYNQFARPEFGSIAGKYYKNLLIVALIFLLSLLAIGFGRGMIDYLSDKMQDPFIKFVNVTIPYSVGNMKWDDLNREELKNKYKYTDVEQIHNAFMDFKSVDNKIVGAKTRKIKESSEFYNFIIKEPGILLTDKFNNTFDNNSIGVVVTENYLQKLGYKEEQIKDVNFIQYVNVIKGKDRYIPIPVSAIVSQLPNHVDLLISEKLFEYNRKDDEIMDITSYQQTNYLKFFIDTNKEDLKPLKEKGFNVSKNSLSHTKEGFILTKNGVENPKEEIENLPKGYKNHILRIYDLDRSAETTQNFGQPDKISFPFNSLDSIYKFQNYLKNKYEINMNMHTIENKKNFYLFNNIANVLSSALILFSILMVIFFVSNTILAHIERNKKNLGTLKAFGLSNNSIVWVYSSIGAFMVVVAFLIALIFCWLTGNPFMNFLINLADMDVSMDAINFDLNFIGLAVLFFVVLPNVFIYLRLKSALNKQTPGDLIYERK